MYLVRYKIVTVVVLVCGEGTSGEFGRPGFLQFGVMCAHAV